MRNVGGGVQEIGGQNWWLVTGNWRLATGFGWERVVPAPRPSAQWFVIPRGSSSETRGICSNQSPATWKPCGYTKYYNAIMKTKLRKIGTGYGVLLPKRVVDALRLSVGDELELTADEGGIELSPFDPEFAEQVEAFRRTEGQHRNSYRELGK